MPSVNISVLDCNANRNSQIILQPLSIWCSHQTISLPSKHKCSIRWAPHTHTSIHTHPHPPHTPTIGARTQRPSISLPSLHSIDKAAAPTNMTMQHRRSLASTNQQPHRQATHVRVVIRQLQVARRQLLVSSHQLTVSSRYRLLKVG